MKDPHSVAPKDQSPHDKSSWGKNQSFLGFGIKDESCRLQGAPDLAKFCHLGKILQVFGHFLRVHLVVPSCDLTLASLYAIGQFFIKYQ